MAANIEFLGLNLAFLRRRAADYYGVMSLDDEADFCETLDEREEALEFLRANLFLCTICARTVALGCTEDDLNDLAVDGSPGTKADVA